MKIAKLKIKNSFLFLGAFFVAGFIFFGINVNSAEAAITISGTIYTSDLVDFYDCSGNTLSVMVEVNGAGDYTADCTANDGTWSVSSVTIGQAGDVVTVFLNGETEKAATVIKAEDTVTDIYYMDMAISLLLVGNYSGSFTNADLDQYDNTCNSGTGDSDLPFCVDGGDLTVSDGFDTIIGNAVFTPGGSITTSPSSDGTDSNVDGDLSIFGGLIEMEANDLSVGGDLFGFNISYIGSQTTTFTATGSGFEISGNDTYNNLVFNGSGGEWTTTGTTTLDGDLTVTDGTFITTDDITGTSGHTFSVSNGAFFEMSGISVYPASFSTYTYGATSTVSYLQTDGTTVTNATYGHLNLKPAGATPLVLPASLNGIAGNLTIGDGTNAGATASANNPTITVTGDVTIAAGANFTSTSGVLSIGGNYSNDGTFTNNSGTVTFTATDSGNTIGGTLSSASDFSKLIFNGSGGEWTLGANLETDGASATAISVAAGTLKNGGFSITGNGATDTFSVSNGAFFEMSGTSAYPASFTTYTYGATSTVSYLQSSVTVTAATYGHLTLGGTGTYTLPASDVTLNGNLVVTSGATVTKSAANKLIFAGGTTQTITDNNGTAQDLGIVQVSDSSGGADPWCNISASACNSSWLARRKITLDNSASAENLTNFPVLVQLSASNIDYAKTQGAGEDIRFVDADGTTALSYEIEAWNESGTSLVWVKVPQIDSGSTTDYIYMYFDNDGATDNQAATSVWDSSFKAVYHLPDGTTLSALDSTSGNHDGTITAATATTGKVDGAASFNGSTTLISAPAAASIDDLTNITISEWIYVTAFTNAFGKGLTKGDSSVGWATYANSARTNIEFFREYSGTDGQWGTGVGSVSTGQWYHFAVTHDGSTSIPTFYLNGAVVASPNTQTTPTESLSSDSSKPLNQGGVSGIASNFLNGNLDETRLSNAIRSADWVEAEYLYTLDNTKYSYGSEETPPSNSTVNLASSVKATTLTIDSSQTLGAGSNTLTITGGGTGTSRPLYNNGGTLTVSSATVNFIGTSATEIENTTFNNLGVGTTVDSTATTYTLRGTTTVTTALTIGNAGSTNNDILNTSTDYALSAGSINITAVGTLTANGSAITLTGTGTPFTVSGTFTPGTGTVTYTGSNPVTVTSTTYHHLTLNNSGTSFTQGGAITNDTGGNLTVTAGTLKSGGYNITGTGTGVFSVANSASFEMSGNSDYPASFGTYTYGATSNVRYLQDQAKTVTNASYGNLKIAPSADDITFTLPATLSTVAGNVLIGDGTNAGIITAATNNPAITISGTFSVNDEATFIGGSSAFTAAGTTSIGGGASGVFTAGSGTVSFAGTFTVQDGATFTQGAGDATFSSNATIGGGASGTFTAGSGDINVAANLAISSGATFTKGTGTVIFKKGATQTWTDSTSGQDLGIVQVSDSSGGTWCNISASACNSSWLARRKITLNNSASSENLTNFPVLVQLSASNIDYAKTQGAGEDIRFVDADGTTALSYEIEKWNESGTSLVWVKVPQIDSGSTTDYIYMYFDNDGASDNQAATSVWDSNFKAVWHLPDGTTLGALDSTSNNNDGTITTPTATTGQIDGGASFNGTSDIITAGSATSLDDLGPLTFSAWIRPNSMGEANGGIVMGKSNGTGDLRFNFAGTNALSLGKDYATTDLNRTTSNSTVTMSAWNYVVVTWDGSATATNILIYVNGAETTYQTTTNGVGAIQSDAALNFNIGNLSGLFHTFDGVIDEARASGVARSADWVEAEYLYTLDNAKYSYGSEETPPSNTTVNLASSVKASSLTIDSSQTFSANGSNTLTLTGAGLTNNGTFTASTGTVTMAPSNTNTPAVVNGSTATTFNNFTATIAGTQLQFKASQDTGFDGTLTVTGSSTNYIFISSDSGGTKWDLNLTGSASISFVNLTDSGCAGGTNSPTLHESVNDQGNNTTSCWVFISRGGSGGASEGSSGGGTVETGGGDTGGSGGSGGVGDSGDSGGGDVETGGGDSGGGGASP